MTIPYTFVAKSPPDDDVPGGWGNEDIQPTVPPTEDPDTGMPVEEPDRPGEPIEEPPPARGPESEPT